MSETRRDLMEKDIRTANETLPSSDGRAVETGPEIRYYSRFSAAQRYLHGFIAVTFLGLAITGLDLRFSNAHWAVVLSRAVGGFGTVLFFHLFNAVVLTVAFLIHLANIGYRVVARKEYGLV